MAFDPDFLDMMTSTVQYQPFTTGTRDVYGTLTFTQSIDMPAHITYDRKITRDKEGEESISTAQLQIPPPGYVWQEDGDFPITILTVQVDDHFKLPLDTLILPTPGVLITSRRVLAVTIYTDDLGTHHQSIDLT